MSSLNDVAAHRIAKAQGQDPRLIFGQHRDRPQFQKVEKDKYLGPVPKGDDGLLVRHSFESLECATRGYGVRLTGSRS